MIDRMYGFDSLWDCNRPKEDERQGRNEKKKKKKNRMDSMECFWSGMISDGRSSLVDRDDDHDHQKQK